MEKTTLFFFSSSFQIVFLSELSSNGSVNLSRHLCRLGFLLLPVAALPALSSCCSCCSCLRRLFLTHCELRAACCRFIYSQTTAGNKIERERNREREMKNKNNVCQAKFTCAFIPFALQVGVGVAGFCRIFFAIE